MYVVRMVEYLVILTTDYSVQYGAYILQNMSHLKSNSPLKMTKELIWSPYQTELNVIKFYVLPVYPYGSLESRDNMIYDWNIQLMIYVIDIWLIGVYGIDQKVVFVTDTYHPQIYEYSYSLICRYV